MKRIFDKWSSSYAHRVASIKSSAIRDLLGVATRPDIISFAGGLPSPEAFDRHAVERAVADVLGEEFEPALQYGPSEGLESLRESIAVLMKREGVHVHPDDILITDGAQQALDLLGKVFLEPGSEAVVEAPSYVGALNAFLAYEPRITAIPLDDEGIDVGALERELDERSHTPRFVYVVPNFHNPAGVTLSAVRRDALLALAAERDITLIEDNPYGELRFDGDPLPSLRSRNDEIVYLGTLSKVLSPGLRIGWASAPRPILEKMQHAKQGADLCSSSLTQHVADRFLRAIDFDTHVEHIRDLYRSRRDAMLAALEEFFPDECVWTRPAGGFFLWAQVPEYVDTVDMLAEAVEHKVAYVPGDAFYADGRGRDRMRLSFCYPDEDEIHEGVKRLAVVVKDQIAMYRAIFPHVGKDTKGDE